MWDQLWFDVTLATMTDNGDPYGTITDGGIAITDGIIDWVGQKKDLPGPPESLAHEAISSKGRWITPGLIDCHTHLVFGGTRLQDFEMRLAGASRDEIVKAGGGVTSTIQSTQDASHSVLLRSAERRLTTLLAEGVTTVEVKSGYGQDLENELKLLRVAQELGSRHPVSIVKTFGVYAIPHQFSGGRQAFVDYVCGTMLPAAVQDGDAVAADVQVDELGFSKKEARQIFQTAKDLGLMLRCHTDELSDFAGVRFMADLGATTADHLEFVSEEGVAAMAKAGMIAVLLPGNTHILQRKQIPPIASLRKHGVPIAVATNCNPGPSPTTSILLMMNFACVLYRLTPEEALTGVTRHAAAALGLSLSHGTLESGKVADFVVWDIEHPAELTYYLGFNPVAQVVKSGKLVLDRTSHDENAF